MKTSLYYLLVGLSIFVSSQSFAANFTISSASDPVMEGDSISIDDSDGWNPVWQIVTVSLQFFRGTEDYWRIDHLPPDHDIAISGAYLTGGINNVNFGNAFNVDTVGMEVSYNYGFGLRSVTSSNRLPASNPSDLPSMELWAMIFVTTLMSVVIFRLLRREEGVEIGTK